jgi:hypothetical protein
MCGTEVPKNAAASCEAAFLFRFLVNANTKEGASMIDLPEAIIYLSIL